MSLADLLNFGKKAVDPNEAPIQDSSVDWVPPEEIAAEKAAQRPTMRLNEEELKMAQELASSQSKALEPEMLRRKDEEEARERAVMDKAAAQAKELAKKAKAAHAPHWLEGQSNNPFSSGGTEFKRGVFVCDTAFGGSRPAGARSIMPDSMAENWDHDRSRSPTRMSADGWGGCGGAAAFGKGCGGWGAGDASWGGAGAAAAFAAGAAAAAWGGAGGPAAWGDGCGKGGYGAAAGGWGEGMGMPAMGGGGGCCKGGPAAWAGDGAWGGAPVGGKGYDGYGGGCAGGADAWSAAASSGAGAWAGDAGGAWGAGGAGGYGSSGSGGAPLQW